MQIRYKCPKINTIMYKSSVMLLLYITMKINSSGKERSHKYTASKLSHIFVWYSLVMYIKSVHYCPVHKLNYPALRLFLSFGFLSIFCSSNVSIDGRMFGFSIGASPLGLGECTESNEPVCGNAMSGLRGNGLPVVRCLQNMALSIMIKLYDGL